jgi:hypothetical protein
LPKRALGSVVSGCRFPAGFLLDAFCGHDGEPLLAWHILDKVPTGISVYEPLLEQALLNTSTFHGHDDSESSSSSLWDVEPFTNAADFAPPLRGILNSSLAPAALSPTASLIALSYLYALRVPAPREQSAMDNIRVKSSIPQLLSVQRLFRPPSRGAAQGTQRAMIQSRRLNWLVQCRFFRRRTVALAFSAPQTDAAMELQGDIIEAVRELARCAGPAVPRAVAVDRMAFSQLVMRFAAAFDLLQRWLCAEYVVVCRRPDVRYLRDLIFLAAGAHSQNSTTSAVCLQPFHTALGRLQTPNP